MHISTLLLFGNGIFWSLAYLLIIRRSMLDQTYGMPLVALCANISWEFIFSFIYPPQSILLIANIVWFALDVIMLLQVLRYGPREFADLPKWAFYLGFGLTLVTAFCVVLLITLEFQYGAAYAAFSQNLMMSALFIGMLYRRRSLHGQSISIAICKLLGTALASLSLFQITPPSTLLEFLGMAIFVYDVIYLGLVVYMRQQARAKAAHALVKVSSEVERRVQPT